MSSFQWAVRSVGGPQQAHRPVSGLTQQLQLIYNSARIFAAVFVEGRSHGQHYGTI